MKTSNKDLGKAHSHSHKTHSEKAPARQTGLEAGKSYLVISIVVMAILLGIIIYLMTKGGPTVPGQDYSGNKVKVEFYVMSQCPYGTQVEDAIYPVLQKMGAAVDYQVNYIVREATPGTFQSLHGPKEVAGDIVQLCVNKYDPDKFVEFIACQNKDAANVDTNWNSCASGLGIDTAKVATCLNSDEGKALLRASMEKSNARQATGSPTIYINDKPYQGGRKATDFQSAICQYANHPECANIPKCSANADCTAEKGKEGQCVNPGKSDAKCTYSDPVAVDYIVLTDDKCTTCDTTQVVQIIQQLFLGGKPRIVDIDDAEGKTLIAKYGITVAPAYIFDSSVTTTGSWTSVQGLSASFDALSDGKYKIKNEAIGATYFVSEEARAAYAAEQEKLNAAKYESLGIKKGDNKPQIDFFVMAYCPYGNQAEEGIAPVRTLLKDKATFVPHYVIYSNFGGGGPSYCLPGDVICSMHGIQELNQNIRETCTFKYEGVDAWFSFALAMNKQCTSQNADSCWEAVAKGLKLDTERIKTCEKNEGEALMKADLDLGTKLGVQGSPTVFVDGVEFSGGRTPEAFKQGLCSSFETQPAECSSVLAGDAAAPAAGGAGCGV